MALGLAGIGAVVREGLIYVFAIELNWLPSYGRGQTVY